MTTPSDALESRVWVVIPALNAAARLSPVVTGCLEQGYEGRTIVVDDGSSDGTADVARIAGARVVRHPHNRGKGEALRTGFELACSERAVAVVTLDADGQHLPSEIPGLIRTWKDSSADLVIGSRDHLFSEMVRRRRLANRFSARMISIFAGVRVSDSQSGFRLYSRRFIHGIDFESSGFAAESEMIVIGGRRGMAIEETPIRLGFVDGVSTSHYRPLLDTLRIAASVVAAAMRPVTPPGTPHAR